MLTLVLLPAALLGVAFLNQTGQRPAARLFGLGTLGFLVLAVAGLVSPPLGRFCTARLVVAALLFAVVPAGHALSNLLALAARAPAAGSPWRVSVPSWSWGSCSRPGRDGRGDVALAAAGAVPDWPE